MSVATPSTMTLRRTAVNRCASSPVMPTAYGPCALIRLDEFAADLTEQHHPRHVEHLGRGHAEATLEIACDAELFQHRADLRAAAVHHDGMDAAVAQEDHVGGEGRLERVIGHRVAAVLDHDDLVVQLS